jgi:glutamyl-tRNA reductase
MSVLVVGVSHRTATLELLERFAVGSDDASKLTAAVIETPHVREALVLATCNRVEVYAEVERFHGSVEDITTLLAAQTGHPVEELIPAVYVHYDEAAVAHLFAVAAGLDSMVVGEAQILGQVREALRRAQGDDTLGPALNTLFQQGLRVGKRTHTETGIDRAGQSVISVAFDAAAEVLGQLAERRVLVVGAGSIAALAATSARRSGAGEIVVSSRTPEHAERLAAGVSGRAASLAELETEIAAADLVICCTGATAAVVSADLVERALQARSTERAPTSRSAQRAPKSPAAERVPMTRSAERPLVFADLALPHDVEPAVADLPGVTVVGLQTVAQHGHEGAGAQDVSAVRQIVGEEVAAYGAARSAARVAPTVVALRSMATTVVSAELERLWGRLDGLTPAQQAEISQAVRRVVDKLLHEPTVRMKELAGRTPDSTYADALAELFSLDPAAVEAVTRAGETP